MLVNTATTQFIPALLQNDSYWGDGKAEFDIYDAQIVREGQPRHCEVLHVIGAEAIDYKRIVEWEQKRFADRDQKAKPDISRAIKFNQIASIPVGLNVEQQMHSCYFSPGNNMLIKYSFSDSATGNNCFEYGVLGTRVVPEELGKHETILTVRRFSDVGGHFENSQVLPTWLSFPQTGFLYEEMPLRVRTIDFSKPSGEFEIQLAASILNKRREMIEFKSAKVSFKTGDRAIDVDVKHGDGTDHFVLDHDFPFLLREWSMADGSRLKLKNSLKVDYRNYNKNGDRERALKDPMLRHPD